MPARIASHDGGLFPPRAKSNQETERRLGDEAKGYGACSRASRGPFLRLPATVFPPSPRRCVAGSPAGALGRGTVAADADAEDEQGSARLIGIRVVLWSRGVGESEARLRLSFFSPFLSLFFATAGQ